MFEALLEGLVAGVIFENGERLGGGLPVRPEEGNTVAVACGVDADADAVQRSSGGDRHGETPRCRATRTEKVPSRWGRTVQEA